MRLETNLDDDVVKSLLMPFCYLLGLLWLIAYHLSFSNVKFLTYEFPTMDVKSR